MLCCGCDWNVYTFSLNTEYTTDLYIVNVLIQVQDVLLYLRPPACKTKAQRDDTREYNTAIELCCIQYMCEDNVTKWVYTTILRSDVTKL